MPKLNKQNKVGNHWIYITPACTESGKEIPHVHHNKSNNLARSLAGKIWVYPDGSSKVHIRSSATDKELREIQKWIADNLAAIEAVWKQLGGAWVWFIK